VPFAVGTGIRDTGSYVVDERWNDRLAPYWWDDRDQCLSAGATSLYVHGHGLGLHTGQALLVDTAGPTAADSHERQVVTLIAAGEQLDPMFAEPVTRLHWSLDDALTSARDLTRTRLAGNLLPATQGAAHSELFVIAAPAGGPAGVTPAVARWGPNSTAASPNWVYRHTLGVHPVASLPAADDRPQPEVTLLRAGAQPRRWTWVRSLLEAGEFEEKFTIDPASWRPAGRPELPPCFEYDGADGATVRFGDGVFGARPVDGDVFEVRYRDSRGVAGNVPADAVTGVDAAWAHVLVAVTNPFAASGGADAESAEQIRQRAPAAFRAVTHRAVRPEDYNAIATRLPWVQRAGTAFRWTGSWHSVFVTADPKGAGAISRDRRQGLSQLVNRTRLAGYEAYVAAPIYVSLDLEIVVCAAAAAFRGDVFSLLDEALRPVRRTDGQAGFFHFDNFTLGTPFERSRLEAAIQRVPGVAGVLSIRFRRRGVTSGYRTLPMEYPIGSGEIFRLDNDANHPERGTYRLVVQGGR
jgi:predicted phage baseplate assembly protein